LGSVGAPMPCNEIKLVDVVEMAYLHNDKPNPRGEIWLRGPNVFAGYHKDEKGTREAIDSSGWLRTGMTIHHIYSGFICSVSTKLCLCQ
jgi:long-chain acyl-CoA synthetase